MHDINQLTSWALGYSRHSLDGQCCPDFSCCNDKINLSVEFKVKFLTAFGENDPVTIIIMQAFIFQMLNTQSIVITEYDSQTKH